MSATAPPPPPEHLVMKLSPTSISIANLEDFSEVPPSIPLPPPPATTEVRTHPNVCANATLCE
jgi:hypothetical protein